MRYFFFLKDYILLEETEHGFSLPETEALFSEDLFFLDEHHAAARLTQAAIPSEGKLVPLREAYLLLDEALCQSANRAKQLLQWREDHRFCGHCGTIMEFYDNNRAKHCPACQLTQYPRIAPCIMVAISRGQEILLARSPHFPPGIFSVLAGFVEPGETLEACVEREVYEEVGLKINNIRYVASQPWPFPHQLMLGFQAEYAEGEITIDQVEIEEAKWFKKDTLPPLPAPFSLAYRLIML